MTNLLGQNTKMKNTSAEMGVKLVNFNIPAFEDPETGKRTCPWAGACASDCYARKNRYKFRNVQSSLARKYFATKREDFVDVMSAELEKSKADFVRIHDAGDYYSPQYVHKWLTIIGNFPDKNFYSYTKSLPFFMGKKLPENFDIIYSLGGKLDDRINVDIHKHSKIFDTAEEIIASGYEDCSHNDLLATKWYSTNNKKGLIRH